MVLLNCVSKRSSSQTFCDASHQLRKLAVCSRLQDDVLQDLFAISDYKQLSPKKTIFSEEESSPYIYGIVDGYVRLQKTLADGRRQITGFMYNGDLLGIPTGSGYAYNAETITNTLLIRVRRDGITKVLNRYPSIEHRLLQLLSNELAATQEHVLLLGRKTATERLCSFLVALARRQSIHDDRVEIALPMSRQDIADYLGLTLETVCRTFARLKKSGTLDVPASNKIVVLAPDKLGALAHGI